MSRVSLSGIGGGGCSIDHAEWTQRDGAENIGNMPSLLGRYVAGEILKSMLLTTAVLVAVIAFGAAIKPLAQNLIGGGDVLKYVLVASIPMLQYALPFAAGFAATLVVHRMASDNELLAMSLSGLSYQKIMRPVYLIGAGLLAFMLLLVNFGVPYFWTQMEAMLARDITRLLATSVERGEAFSLGNTQIFADQVLIIDDPEDSNAESRLVLMGVAALETDDKDELKTEFTSEYATLDVHRIDGRAILKLAFGDSTIFREGDEALVRVPSAEPRAMDLGQGFTRQPKSFTLSELITNRTHNEDYPEVAVQRKGAFEAIARADAWRCVADAISSDTPFLLRDSRRKLDYQIRAEECQPPQLIGSVEVEEIEDGVAVRRARGATAELRLSEVLPGEEPRFNLIFEPEDVRDLESPELPAARWPTRLARLDLVDCSVTGGEGLDNTALLARIASVNLPEGAFWDGLGEKITQSGERIERARRELRWDIDARIQQRFAQSLMAPFLLLLGAVLAVTMKTSAPLAVYLVAFLPSIVAILLISTGEQELRDGPNLIRELVLWSGNVLLLGVVVLVWMRMRRH